MVSLSATTIPGPKSGSAGNGAAASLSPAAARGEESSFGEQMRRWGKFVVGDRRDEIVHAEVGPPYDGCHETTKKMVWIHMVGHLRSFESRQHNLKAFRDALPCSMLVIYTMDHIEGTGAAWWGNREQLAGANASSDVLALLERSHGVFGARHSARETSRSALERSARETSRSRSRSARTGTRSPACSH